MDEKIFVNRTLNLKKIKYLGFDMDHTIVRYNSEKFEALVYEFVVEFLINNKQYPQEIKQLKFNFLNAIRGSIVDCENGNILKLSRYGTIRQSYHGVWPIKFNFQNQIYKSTYVDLNDPKYIAIDTSFSIAFCVLYAQLVSYKDKHPSSLPSYQVIAADVLYSVDRVHADGKLKDTICANMENFVILDDELVSGLLNFKKFNKKLFVLTNSDYFYTKKMLDYVINRYLKNGQTWQDIFEFTITLSNKPRFFYDNMKFLKVDLAKGNLTNYSGEIKPGVYQGGNAKQFTKDLALNGDEILYIGDHIYGDILRLKKDCNWRTALVVEELGGEIRAQIKSLPIQKQIKEHMSMKEVLEKEYISLLSKLNAESEMQADSQPSASAHEDSNTESMHQDESRAEYQKKYIDKQTLSNQDDKDLQKIHHKIMDLDSKIAALLAEERMYFNPIWGKIFRSGAEESYFAHQVEKYACIYMEKLSNLLKLSPLSYFRANKRRLAHDPD